MTTGCQGSPSRLPAIWCGLLVAAYPAGQSGKAGKTRSWGIPIIGATDFLTATPGDSIKSRVVAVGGRQAVECNDVAVPSHGRSPAARSQPYATTAPASDPAACGNGAGVGDPHRRGGRRIVERLRNTCGEGRRLLHESSLDRIIKLCSRLAEDSEVPQERVAATTIALQRLEGQRPSSKTPPLWRRRSSHPKEVGHAA